MFPVQTAQIKIDPSVKDTRTTVFEGKIPERPELLWAVTGLIVKLATGKLPCSAQGITPPGDETRQMRT